MKELCPMCGTELRWKMVSSGGDGMTYCPNPECGWVEDFSKPLDEPVRVEE